MTTYTVRTPTTSVAVRSPVTSVHVQGVGVQGRSGPTLPIVFHKQGPALPLVGKARYRFPFAATLRGVSAAVSAPPTGAGIVFDVLVNGAVAGTFTLADGAWELAEQTVSVPISVGDYVTVDIASVGSATNGDDLSIFIRYTA